MDADNTLVQAAREGDAGAIEALVRRYQVRIFNHARILTCDDGEAEDLAQETFIRAFRGLKRFRGESSFKNWLYRIATNVAIDALRRQRETTDVDEIQLASPDTGPEARVEEQERSRIVQEAVLALPPASRAVLVLREYEGLSYREIADTLDIPIGTVMSRLNYARNRLRKSLAPYLEAL